MSCVSIHQSWTFPTLSGVTTLGLIGTRCHASTQNAMLKILSISIIKKKTLPNFQNEPQCTVYVLHGLLELYLNIYLLICIPAYPSPCFYATLCCTCASWLEHQKTSRIIKQLKAQRWKRIISQSTKLCHRKYPQG